MDTLAQLTHQYEEEKKTTQNVPKISRIFTFSFYFSIFLFVRWYIQDFVVLLLPQCALSDEMSQIE